MTRKQLEDELIVKHCTFKPKLITQDYYSQALPQKATMGDIQQLIIQDGQIHDLNRVKSPKLLMNQSFQNNTRQYMTTGTNLNRSYSSNTMCKSMMVAPLEKDKLIEQSF